MEGEVANRNVRSYMTNNGPQDFTASSTIRSSYLNHSPSLNRNANLNRSTNLTPPYLIRGKLPHVGSSIERKMCTGRVWIFLILGVVLFVLGLVSLGIYLNLRQMTTSMEYVEIMPLYVTSAAVLLAGLSVTWLFWRRDKILVLITVGVNVLAAVLCVIIGVLTLTHVLQPLRTFTRCRYYESQSLCQCFSPYKRDVFSLQLSENDETKYNFEAVTSCEEIEVTLPTLLYTLAVSYCAVFLVSLFSSLIALLVLRAERNKRNFIGADSYEEVYTVSGSSQDQSDSESEVTTFPQGQLIVAKNSNQPVTINRLSPSSSLLRNPTQGFNSGNPAGSHFNSVDRSTLNSQLTNQGPVLQNIQVQRSKTPAPPDLSKETLANRYRISKTPDRELKVRQRLSKTPDREIGAHRRYSFTSNKRLSKSCESLDSSGGAGNINFVKNEPTEKRKSKLKEHRKKSKRAATVHTLDTDQLLLILNLQMRYLQESKEQENNTPVNTNTRRAITPQPVSHKAVIPQKIRSHTPQPRRANGRIPDAREHQGLYNQNVYRQQLMNEGRARLNSSANSSRRTSESSDKNSSDRNFDTGNSVSSRADGEFIYYQSLEKPVTDSYLHCQQLRQHNQNLTDPNIRNGYNPYIFTQGQKQVQSQSNGTAPNSLHYVTYSDSMLNNPPKKPKSRASVQSHFLPPQPIHRGQHQNLPPKPVSRQQTEERQLPPQPVSRGNSAFHIVDRKSKSRSPSITNERLPQSGSLDSTPRRHRRKDYADIAVRDNFCLNKNPVESSVPHSGEASENGANTNFILRDRNAESDDILPSYSGPPSYKEYASSCNTSKTSSLSSNPDDVFGMPKRRLDHTKLVNEGGAVPSGNAPSKIVSGNLYKLTGTIRGGNKPATESSQTDGNIPSAASQSGGVMENFKLQTSQQGQGQRTDAEGQEVIYSAPTKSRVKAIIVPEDYYSSVNKPGKQDALYANRKLDTMPPMPPMSEVRKYNAQNHDYGNVDKVELSGYKYMAGDRIHGQIGPEDKYEHEYEDVYGPDGTNFCPASADKGLGSTNSNNDGQYLPAESYTDRVRNVDSVNTPTFSEADFTRDPKSKQKIPKKLIKGHNHVTDVFANSHNGNYGNSGAGVNSQVSDSVENVHAEKVGRIPRIKLNDRELGTNRREHSEDKVFVDDGSVSSEHVGVAKPNFNNDSVNQNYEEIDDLQVSDQNPVDGHMTRDSSNENEAGYMMMSLPGKSGQVPGSENYGIAIHLTGTTNQNDQTGHVTPDLSSNSYNSGTSSGVQDLPSNRDSQNYEETGV